MAHIDDLVNAISDVRLRSRLHDAVANLRRAKNFGLVFEEHIPETVLLPSGGIQSGATVVRRNTSVDGERFEVLSVAGDTLTVADGEGQTATLSRAEVLVVKKFGEPVYPVLTPVMCLRRDESKPSQIVINSENFHALQLLLFQHRGAVDCIYIDPPYNTGAKDWQYNNHYVDDTDDYRHSKWLSFMEKRLRLAKDLLKPLCGVLVVTIDEKEVHHLGMLLEEIFPNAIRQMVTIVTNPLGQARKQELARVEEYAFLVLLGNASPCAVQDDLLTDATPSTRRASVRWEWLIRGGTHSSRRERPNLFFPVYVDPAARRIVEVGDSIAPASDRRTMPDRQGLTTLWPLNQNGQEGNWRCSPAYLRRLVEQGYAKVGAYDSKNERYSVLYLGKAQMRRIESGEIKVIGRDANNAVILEGDGQLQRLVIAKTVWARPRHRAGEYGTALMKKFVPGADFPFPKSVYAVLDTLRIVVGNRPDALILDFFAGSGTTLHATCLLNAEDGGRRQCILVTNNEVGEAETRILQASRLYRGDAEFEAAGIFELVTLPRIQAAFTGRLATGKPVEGSYIGGRKYDEGFAENLLAYRLDYANPVDVELGLALEAILPALWMAAGAIGDPTLLHAHNGMVLTDGYPFAVLNDEDRIKDFLGELSRRDDITHVWLVTDSELAFAQMRSLIPGSPKVGMLYRDYLRNFELNARVAQ
jgi:adenine-specific DNA-methyltransferase